MEIIQHKINADFFKYIGENSLIDPNRLRLKNLSKYSFDAKFAITQIECRNKIRNKLPEIYLMERFLFPSQLSTEQCSCEQVAKFHASILNGVGDVLDITAGLCVDDYYISQFVKSVTSIERDAEIAMVDEYNMGMLRNNVSIICEDAVKYINDCELKYDTVFADPARRGNNNSRVFGLTQCEPDIVSLLPKLKKIANVLYIKASPMIDITQSLKDITDITDIWVISVKNECKELFFRVSLNQKVDNGSCAIHTINIGDGSKIQELSYEKNKFASCGIIFSETVKNYLYEPNASIMKANAFMPLQAKFNVGKLQQNSHLFTNDTLLPDFPGRKFKVAEMLHFDDKSIKYISSKYSEINVTVRNFKLSAELLKKRLKVKDGGEEYLFGTTLQNGEMVLIICERIN